MKPAKISKFSPENLLNTFLMKIALIAHDGKKADMVHFLSGYRKRLVSTDVELYATGTTGSHIEKSGIPVKKLLSGPLGGDAQIAAMVAQKELSMVIFFRDPLDKHPHEPDVQMLMRLCDVHNIPLATNPASAELMIKQLIAKI
jgi:methylglyoxal synthase